MGRPIVLKTSAPDGLRRPRLGRAVPDLRGVAAAASRRLTPRQISTLLGLIGLLLLAVGTAFTAWNERRVLYDEGRNHAEQSAAYLADHALRLFEVADLVLHNAEAALGRERWDEVARSPTILDGFRRMSDMLPYVDTVFAADASGRIRLTTLDNAPPDYSIADRKVFLDAQHAQGDTLLIGDAIIGRVTHHATFQLARRRTGGQGFDGLVGASMTLSYFTDYWRTLDKRNDEEIALVRAESGSILAHYPDRTTAQGEDTIGTRLLPVIAGGSRTGFFVPAPHQMGAYRKVGDLPLYIVVTFRDSVIAAQWRASLAQLLPLAGVGALALVLFTALARRLARREEIARRQIETARAVLSATNARLERRVAARTADLLESNREIQRFAYIVSHDLRAPLVNIMGFTSEVETLSAEILETPHPLDETGKARVQADLDEAFGFIRSSIDKMDRLIKAILALSRQGQRVLKPEPLDMDILMRSVADGVAHRVQACGATIVIDPLPPVTADRIAVEQIFANLLDNAVKYLRPDVPGLIAIAGARSLGGVVYTVTDNGRGIEEADRERVFELFRRAGKQDQPGEGIGLANVRSLVRRLQGTISLDSTPGLGCVFTVTLPRVADEPRD